MRCKPTSSPTSAVALTYGNTVRILAAVLRFELICAFCWGDAIAGGLTGVTCIPGAGLWRCIQGHRRKGITPLHRDGLAGA